ncbi:TPA: IclR family transcriptional regulator [Salmonella enterica subsp. enterica serovar Saintpaul]|nr:IclR family transcriptional regulator [Salmonella enterica]HEC7267523.1 IclR family transcriptional regulator [Salmonella enterica subsp. enterica serovar Saintpaul]EBE6739000.1 IclR family transcriptional regulator [Salmonella enterica]EHI4919054.1 IclR family transcriptional regulator [Salmonella enterica]EHI8911773.1 IclR family transcriptional regulator [Salmonella enterica]
MKKITTSIPALDKIMRVFAYLLECDGATFTQIHQNSGIAKSSTSSLLNGMVEHGLLRQEKDKYYLGLRLYELGNKAAEQYDIKKIALPILEEIRDNTGLTCHLGVLEGDAPIYLLKVESPQAIVIRSWEGKRLSLHSSGLGKVLIAWLSGEELEELLPPDQILTRFTDTTITDVNILKQELAGIRRRGWGYDNEEDSLGVRCIAVPVFNTQGKVIAALSVSGVTFQIPDDKRESLATLMMDASRSLTRLIC